MEEIAKEVARVMIGLLPDWLWMFRRIFGGIHPHILPDVHTPMCCRGRKNITSIDGSPRGENFRRDERDKRDQRDECRSEMNARVTSHDWTNCVEMERSAARYVERRRQTRSSRSSRPSFLRQREFGPILSLSTADRSADSGTSQTGSEWPRRWHRRDRGPALHRHPASCRRRADEPAAIP